MGQSDAGNQLSLLTPQLSSADKQQWSEGHKSVSVMQV